MAIKVIVLGAGGNCRDIVDAMLEVNASAASAVYEPVGYLDDDAAKAGALLGGVPVLGPLSAASQYPDCQFVNGINGTALMPAKAGILEKTGIPIERFATVVHPRASVSKMAKVGEGSVIFQNVSICSNVTIGRHVAILPNSVVAHDCAISDGVYITANVSLAGYVAVGKAAYLGTSCSVMCRKEIGAEAIVGMGAVVLENVPARAIVAGVPAKIISHRS